jgi:rhodanese-related sulfurtransferase
MNKCVNLNRQIVGYFVVLILLLSLATTIQNFANAQETSGYTEITPQQAYTMINRHHSQNVLVLDVRNESEYSFAHLYGALQIPCYQLEDLIDIYRANPNATIIDYRSVKLMTHINDLIIVYCEKGSRSAIACNSIAMFLPCFNIAGGIDAWFQSNHPI